MIRPEQGFCPELEAAIAAARGPATAIIQRALPRLARMEYWDAENDLREALRVEPSSALAAGVLGLTLTLAGKGAPARPWLDRAVRRAPRRAWPYALRAAAFRKWKRLEAASRDLARAATLEPSVALLALRADLLLEIDDAAGALGCLNRAVRLAGADARLLVARADLNAELGRWRLVLKDISRASALRPDDPVLLVRKADALRRLGLLDEAEGALTRALNLDPADEAARRTRMALRLRRPGRRGAREDARHLLAKGSPEARAEAAFELGYLELASGASDKAAPLFRNAAAFPGASAALIHRAEFYAALCLGLTPGFNRPRRSRAARAELRILGLGLAPPYTVTLETVRALSDCDVMFDNIGDEEVSRFLAVFRREVRPLRYDRLPQPKRVRAYERELFAEIRAGRSPAFVTRGNAMVFGVFARSFIRRCRRLGVGWRALGAVSCVDLLAAMTAPDLRAGAGGIQGLVSTELASLAGLDTRQPLLVFPYGGIPHGQVLAVQRALERFYPASHECRVYGSRYNQPPLSLPLSELAARFPSMDSMLDLYVPPLARK